eukprot:NODE_7994_length_407_cov_135.059659.p4 GENE.NODE_7994_length_407_cov_135.059659~~NODE_7994_length_407_cov_135.059659.p4  ORF type:complete len:109 (+),score=48.24 NODE_7994_length_407_cov_135.059659:3-329(+)
MGYDFWAVGTDCCAPRGEGFECASISSNSTMGGKRVLVGPARDNYRLAVEEAAATYNIQSDHAIFFEIVDDAVGDIDDLKSDGYKIYAYGVGIYAGVQALCVLATGAF